MSFVEIDNRRLEYEALDGDPRRPGLVFLHEGLGSVALWRDFPARVAAATGRRALVYSRLGHGRSDPPGAPRTPRFMHEEALDVLPALLDRFDVREPVLVGHSDGASIALIHAGTAGRPVAGLVLLAPHVFVEDVSIEGITAARRAFEQTDLPERMSRYHRDAHATFRSWNDIWLAPEFRDWSIEDTLKGVSCPVLLVQGDRDEYGTLEQLAAIESGVRGSTERLVLPSGHAPQLECADETVAAVSDFLARTERDDET
ncbi:MAG: alpha/beta fold hydrolase [Solirubrobacteraceae bacterium]